jgi:hypothetical protein
MVDGGMIKFECPSCNAHIRVPDEHAGKRGKCPKCHQRVTVPALPEAQDDLLLLEPLDMPAVPQSFVEDLPSACPEAGEMSDAESPSQAGQRRAPWLIDVFLYPMTQTGFIHLAIFVCIPLLVNLFQTLLGRAAIVTWILAVGIRVAVGLYYYWYIAECVSDSANGGTRVPEAFSSANLSDQFSLAIHLFATYVMFVGPAGFYHLYLHETDTLFWCLAAYGVMFFPMGLLAMVLYQDSSALNPFKLLLAIIKCILPYLGLILLLAGVLGVFALLTRIPVLGQFFAVYGSFILAHLLGRFYWNNQARIGWF